MISINKLITEVEKINKHNIKIKQALSDLECDICCSRFITKDYTFKCDKQDFCKNSYIVIDKCFFVEVIKLKNNLPKLYSIACGSSFIDKITMMVARGFF